MSIQTIYTVNAGINRAFFLAVSVFLFAARSDKYGADRNDGNTENGDQDAGDQIRIMHIDLCASLVDENQAVAFGKVTGKHVMYRK